MKFEEAMDRLNVISNEMEKTGISLDDSLSLYKEAVELVDFCKKYIAEAKLSFEVLR